MRPRSQTLGTLGRSPARQTRQPTPLPTPPEPPPPERGVLVRWLHGAFVTNLGLKFLSMVLAVTVFLLVNTDRDREITARVGVAYTLPDDKVLVSERLEEVRLTIKGPWRKLRGFDERELDRVTLDLRHATAGELALTADMIRLPSGMTVTSINPRMVRIAFEKRIEKLIEITPLFTKQPQHGFVVAEVKAAPATVKVRGAEGVLRTLSTIQTREVNLEGRTDSFATVTDLIPQDGIELDLTQQIHLQVHIQEELVTRNLPGRVVVVRVDGADPAKTPNGDAARWKVTPAQIDVTLTGALLSVEKAKGTMVPTVKIGAGSRDAQVDVTVEGLPPGVGFKLSPERVRVVPVK